MAKTCLSKLDIMLSFIWLEMRLFILYQLDLLKYEVHSQMCPGKKMSSVFITL